MKQYLVVGALILLGVLIYFGLASQGSIIQVVEGGNKVDRPLDTFSATLNGVQMQGEAVYLGEKSASSQPPFLLCGQNEGVTVSNSFTESSSLNLFSTMTAGRGGCENWMNVQGTFPKGKLEVTCSLKASTTENLETSSSCSVNSETRGISVIDKASNQAVEKIIIDTDNTNVKIEARNKPGSGGYSQSDVTIKFTPESSSITGASISSIPASQQDSFTSNSSTELNFFQKFWNWLKNFLSW